MTICNKKLQSGIIKVYFEWGKKLQSGIAEAYFERVM